MHYYQHLNLLQRRIIGNLHKEGFSMRRIAKVLSIAPSTVSRELRRNRSAFGYMCYMAEDMARARRFRASRRPLKFTTVQQQQVIEMLRSGCSPEQISGSMQHSRISQISTETIYRFIRKDKKSGGSLYRLLRRKGKKYRRRLKSIPGRCFIEKRPASVKNKTYFGDWEIDLMHCFKPAGYLLVAVERKSKLVKLAFVKNRTAELIKEQLIRILAPYKVRTITADNGSEFAAHQQIARMLNTKVFFCRPYKAWQKGLVENTIGLLRQWYPKRGHIPHPIPFEEAEYRLNHRPRKSMNFRSPQYFISKLYKI